MDLVFESVPPDLAVRGLDGRKLRPGPGKIELQLATSNYDGDVNETLRFSTRNRGVQVPYEFTIRGHVYTPISLSPRVLKLRNDEREKELVLRNNTAREVKIIAIASETLGTEAKPLPLTLRPGETGRLNLRLGGAFSGINHGETVTLTLDQPIEGVHYLFVSVIHNFVETRVKTPDRLTPSDIEELLRRSRP